MWMKDNGGSLDNILAGILEEGGWDLQLPPCSEIKGEVINPSLFPPGYDVSKMKEDEKETAFSFHHIDQSPKSVLRCN